MYPIAGEAARLSVVSAVIRLAHALDLSVVAEGVKPTVNAQLSAGYGATNCIDALARRLRMYVERSETLKPESAAPGITEMPERSARRVLNDTIGGSPVLEVFPLPPATTRVSCDRILKLKPLPAGLTWPSRTVNRRT